MLTRFSDGTICEYCGNLILTELGLEYKEKNKIFCCKDCVDDYKRKIENAMKSVRVTLAMDSLYLTSEEEELVMQKTIGEISKEEFDKKVMELVNEEVNVMNVNKEQYGTLNGHYLWDLAVDWVTHSNDSFYNNYGFTFVPTGELYEEVKQYLNEMND